jgi:hypothetical protein
VSTISLATKELAISRELSAVEHDLALVEQRIASADLGMVSPLDLTKRWHLNRTIINLRYDLNLIYARAAYAAERENRR